MAGRAFALSPTPPRETCFWGRVTPFWVLKRKFTAETGTDNLIEERRVTTGRASDKFSPSRGSA